jgi:hypothetical protein
MKMVERLSWLLRFDLARLVLRPTERLVTPGKQ